MKSAAQNNDFVTVKIYRDDLAEMFEERFNSIFGDHYSLDEAALFIDALTEHAESGDFNNKFFNVSEIVDNFVINQARITRPEDFDYSENVERIENGDLFCYGETESEDGTIYLISKN